MLSPIKRRDYQNSKLRGKMKELDVVRFTANFNDLPVETEGTIVL